MVRDRQMPRVRSFSPAHESSDRGRRTGDPIDWARSEVAGVLLAPNTETRGVGTVSPSAWTAPVPRSVWSMWGDGTSVVRMGYRVGLLARVSSVRQGANWKLTLRTARSPARDTTVIVDNVSGTRHTLTMNTTTHTGTVCAGDSNCCTNYGACPACRAARKAVNDAYVAALDAESGGPVDASVHLLPSPHFLGRD
jgi:hypothetical protein